MRLEILAVVLAWTAVAGAGERKLYVNEFRDRMAGAWIGQSVGVAYGNPTEFKHKGTIIPDAEMPVWKPELIENTFHQDDLYVEMTFIRTLETRGIDVSARDAGIDFANSRYRLWCANWRGRNLLREGIAAPASSHPKYHESPDDIDYQIESDFSGILSPGMPARVIRLGDQFGRLMNYGDGLYAGVFMGAMYAEAYFEADRRKVVAKALEAIPSASRYAEMVRDMLAWHKADPKDWKKAWKLANDKWYANGKSAKVGKVTWAGIDVKINGAQVLLGYLWGDGDIKKTMYIATAGGFDSDCNPSSALGVLGAQLGAKAFGPEYVSKLSHMDHWEYTAYTYDDLLKVCEKLTRQILAAEGGKVGRDARGEYFEIPERAVDPGVACDSLKPGPCGDEHYADAERKQILYRAQKDMGEPSCRVAEHLIGQIADAAKYEGLHPRFAKAFAFLKRADLSTLAKGDYILEKAADGTPSVKAMVQELDLTPWKGGEATIEAHRRFIDIQAPLDGPETFGLVRLDPKAKDFKFDEAKDYGLVQRDCRKVVLHPGEFAIFFPPDGAHAPCLTDSDAKCRRRKVCIKILAD